MNTQEEFEKWYEDEKGLVSIGDAWNEATERQRVKITAFEAENRRLRDSQENTVKMLQSVMQILDRVALK